jgi:hypothetical protein
MKWFFVLFALPFVLLAGALFLNRPPMLAPPGPTERLRTDFRFHDDVTVRTGATEKGTLLHARCASRIGKGIWLRTRDIRRHSSHGSSI